MRLQPVEFDWMSDDDDEVLLPDWADDEALDDSPVVVVVEYFWVDGPADDGDDLESFELAFEVLEELRENEN